MLLKIVRCSRCAKLVSEIDGIAACECGLLALDGRREAHLSPKPMKMFRAVLHRPGISVGELIETVWEPDEEPEVAMRCLSVYRYFVKHQTYSIHIEYRRPSRNQYASALWVRRSEEKRMPTVFRNSHSEARRAYFERIAA